MTELKTLKDFTDKECYCDFEKGELPLKKRRFIPENELKAEAVKWVKEFYKMSWEEKKQFMSSDEFGSGHEGLDFWIKHFFNLTEEDLK